MMAKNRSEVSKFQSKFGAGYITAAQYLAELICEHKSKRDRTPLPYRFWSRPPWKQFFLNQVLAAHALLKQYDADIVIQAVNDPRCYNVFSLRAKWKLEPVLKEKKRIKDSKDKHIKLQTKTPTTQQPRKPLGKKSLFSKLKEINDGGEEERTN
jgi:hypothetical protein